MFNFLANKLKAPINDAFAKTKTRSFQLSFLSPETRIEVDLRRDKPFQFFRR